MFPYRNTHTFTWISPDGKTQIEIDHILIDIANNKNNNTRDLYTGINEFKRCYQTNVT
jgi:hypothetical protein